MANTLQVSKEIIIFLLLTETKAFSFEEQKQKESLIINIFLLKLFFLSDLVSKDDRKQQVTGGAWEMYKNSEAKGSPLYIPESTCFPDEVKKKQTQLNCRVIMLVLYSS